MPTIGITTILPGTQIYERAKRQGLISDDFWLTESPPPLYTGEHSSDDLIALQFQLTKGLCPEMVEQLRAMKDFAGREKISGSLSKVLDQRGAPAGHDPSVGDITYYAPWGNLALFYRDASYAKGLVRLGRFDGDIAALGAQKHARQAIRKLPEASCTLHIEGGCAPHRLNKAARHRTAFAGDRPMVVHSSAWLPNSLRRVIGV